MTIHEPMTAATDYALATFSLFFAVRLARARVRRAWPLTFVFTALGSLAGGTYHALGGGVALWKITVFAIGLASFFLLVATDVPVIVALIKFLVYGSWMIVHDDFQDVILDYGLTLLIVLVLQTMAWFRSRAPAAPWLIGSVIVSVLAALVQQQQLDLHRNFNHNDLYHVVQLAALYLLYRGGLAMRHASPAAGGHGHVLG